MDVSKEINSNVENMKFYCKEIDRLVRIQLEKDCRLGNLNGIETKPGSERFGALGIINSSTGWIETYLTCIENMVKRAEEQDDKLTPLPEQEEIGDAPF